MLKVGLKLMNKLIFFLSKTNNNFATDHQFALLVIPIFKKKMLANH